MVGILVLHLRGRTCGSRGRYALDAGVGGKIRKYGFIALLLLGLPWAVARAQQALIAPSPPLRIGPLRLEKASFSKTSGNCGGRPCVTARVDTLKVVSAENAQAAARISAAIGGFLGPGSLENSQKVLQQYVDNYWQQRQANSEDDPMFHTPWNMTLTVKIEYQSARVLSLSFGESYYEGGYMGRPYGSFIYVNFRPATGERIQPADIFKPAFTAPLNAAA